MALVRAVVSIMGANIINLLRFSSNDETKMNI
jgi:hypothetical protein